jgi:hypothetical protein
MLIKVPAEIFLEVDDEDQAESAVMALDQGLERVLSQAGFPHGEILQADAPDYRKVSDEEAAELGLTE